MLPLVQNSNQMEPRQSKRKNINLPKNQNQPQVGSVVQVLFFLQNSKNSSKEKPKWYKGIVTHIFKKISKLNLMMERFTKLITHINGNWMNSSLPTHQSQIEMRTMQLLSV